jgi:anti-anti-sigma regulatory factor
MTNAVPLSDISIPHGATTIVTLTDKDIGDQIARQPQGHGGAHMMLDFSHVRRFGAAGLTAVLALGRRMRTGRGRLSLVNLGAHVHGVFAAVGLDALFAPHRQEPDLTPRRQSTTPT